MALTRAGKSSSTWKTAFSFADKGTWRLRVIAGKGGSPKAGSVLVGTTVVVQKH